MSSSTASSSDNKTFTLAPSDNLSFYTAYKIKVTTGARDLAGNNLASDNETSTGFETRYWTRQLGTSSAEEGRSVAVDSTNASANVYLTGRTEGALTGTNLGDYDAFLTKYNSSGTRQWVKQISTSSGEYGYGVTYSSNYIYA